LHDVALKEPRPFLDLVLDGVESLAKTGVVHSDLSPYNILVFEGRPWFIDLSEAIGWTDWAIPTGRGWTRPEKHWNTAWEPESTTLPDMASTRRLMAMWNG
jgi:hypothetical protein